MYFLRVIYKISVAQTYGGLSQLIFFPDTIYANTSSIIDVDLSFPRVAHSLPSDLPETVEGILLTHGCPSAEMPASSLKMIIVVGRLASSAPLR